MKYEPIQSAVYEEYEKIKLNHVEYGNSIDSVMISMMHEAIDRCNKKIIVIEGDDDIFCEGANLRQIDKEGGSYDENCAKQMYQLWIRMRKEPFVFISHVKGRVNAGGIGFLAASDIVISNESALYSLSELLFGLYPACVLPFLISKIGFQNSNYMALMTKAFTAKEAYQMGLVDCIGVDSDRILKKHIQRLKYLDAEGLFKYKSYLTQFSAFLTGNEEYAINANKDMFLDRKNKNAISDFVNYRKMPWE